MVKRIALIVGVLALVVSVGVVGVWALGHFASPALAQSVSTEEPAGYSPAQNITVVGQGSTRTEPDVARVGIGVETSAATVSEAVAENETKMTSILAALDAVGIPKEDIQTSHYSVQFDRFPEPILRSEVAESDEAEPQYRVSNMVNVTIHDLDKVSDALDAVIEAGANNIWGVTFSLEDTDAAQADARAKAMADAEARAQALADLGGVELGPVMSISEVITGGGVPMPVMSAERAVAGAGSISPGEVEISYQVQVSYFIEP